MFSWLRKLFGASTTDVKQEEALWREQIKSRAQEAANLPEAQEAALWGWQTKSRVQEAAILPEAQEEWLWRELIKSRVQEAANLPEAMATLAKDLDARSRKQDGRGSASSPVSS